MFNISIASQDLWLVSAPWCECGAQTVVFIQLSVGFSRARLPHRCYMHSHLLVKLGVWPLTFRTHGAYTVNICIVNIVCTKMFPM